MGRDPARRAARGSPKIVGVVADTADSKPAHSDEEVPNR
ncbi:hypothetical protein I553_9762 [Mycobacterium xenopi 4042]|uniref:Uncharacterized protein n=1 Tax=Mycobacterium xenopi 4042 TaxID=1299334 RepID=X7YPJ2_MYCXE|nr:hypothetical protein I553_9762 [Mycobacterium xenopi 4042]